MPVIIRDDTLVTVLSGPATSLTFASRPPGRCFVVSCQATRLSLIAVMKSYLAAPSGVTFSIALAVSLSSSGGTK